MFDLKKLKMKKNYFLIFVIISLTLASCVHNNHNNHDIAEEPMYYEQETETTTYHYDDTLYQKYKNVGFKIPAGEYNSYKDGKKWKQWHFDDNMKDGNYIDFTEMMGLGFEYFVISTESEIKEKVLFHMGSVDDETYGTLEKINDEEYIINFDYGASEKIIKTDDKPFGFGQ